MINVKRIPNSPDQAVGDGVSDDTAAIQAAIDQVVGSQQGGIVHFPPGRYRVTDELSVRNLSFRDASGSGPTQGRVHRLRAAIYVEDAMRISVHNCAFERLAGSAIEVRNCTELHADNISIFRSGDDGHPALSINKDSALGAGHDGFLQAGMFNNLRVEDISGNLFSGIGDAVAILNEGAHTIPVNNREV